MEICITKIMTYIYDLKMRVEPDKVLVVQKAFTVFV